MNNLTQNEAAAAGAGVIVGGALTAVIVFYIFTVIASWKIFEKAGEKGWKSLIPIYNAYLLFKIVGMKNWFWITIIVTMVCTFVASLNGYSAGMTEAEMKAFKLSEHPIAVIALAVDAIVSLVAMIKYALNTAKAFGKGTGFAIALFFFPNICWLILGFGKAKYNKKAVNA